MARRSGGAPQVTEYWWKSPSSAWWAASMSSRGGGKFGMPCARFTPPSWSTTRVISRITDSVNPCTLLDIRSELMGCSCAARPRRCHRRDVTAPDEHAPAWSRPGLVCPSETRVSGHRLGYAYRTGCGVASVGVVNEGHTGPGRTPAIACPSGDDDVAFDGIDLDAAL